MKKQVTSHFYFTENIFIRLILTGIWPGHKQKNKPRMKPSEPWSKTKQKKEEKKEKRLKRKRGKDAKISNNEPIKKKKRKS